MNTWMSRMRGTLLGVVGGLLLLVVTCASQANTVTYVYTDPQGTPLAEADANGNITATFDYAPYGSIAMGTAPNGPGYTGHVNDPDTGFVYMQARYYDPSVGRFLSVDPVGPAAGNAFKFNRFAYANNNPIENIDPDGRCTGSLISDSGGGCAGSGGSIAGPGYTTFVNPNSSEGGSGKGTNSSSSTEKNGASQDDKGSADDDVKKEEQKNALLAFTEEAKNMSEHGLLGKFLPSAFKELMELTGPAVSAADTAANYGKLAASVNGLTYKDAMNDINFYKNSQTIPPTGQYYPGSLINWGKINWVPFDNKTLSLPPETVWKNFMSGTSQLPEYQK